MSLPYVAQAAEHRQIESEGSLLRVLLGADTTDGQVSVLRAQVPGGFAPPVHVHSIEDEIFVLLEGSGIFWSGPNKMCCRRVAWHSCPATCLTHCGSPHRATS